MYGYSEHTPLNLKSILERVSEEQIFEMVLGYFPVEYVRVVSPFREDDTTPGCFFSNFNDKLWFVDFADKIRHRDAINMVQDMYGFTFKQALAYIDNHFELGIGNSNPIPVKHKREEHSSRPVKKGIGEIHFKPRDFIRKDREFWSQYGISKQNLIDDGIFPIIWYSVFSKRFSDTLIIRPNTVSYAYTQFSDLHGDIQEGKVKIYTPHLKNKGKWITNCTGDEVGSYQFLPAMGDKLVISKSYKDCRVLRNLGITSVWFQNEGMIPSLEILEDLYSRFNEIFIFFDNDETGIESSEKIVQAFNSLGPRKASAISLPKVLLDEGIKDPSDTYKEKGKQYLIDFLKVWNLINEIDNTELF